MSRYARRAGTAQKGYPRDRGRWVALALALAVLVGGIAVARGPYGGPLTPLGVGLRIAALVAVALVPPVTLVWAWRRTGPRVRRVLPVVVGVLAVVLLLLAAAHGDVYAERAGMRSPPEEEAESAVRRNDLRFWAVEDAGQAILAPPVANRCILNRHGVRVIPGASGVPVNEAHRVYLEASTERARRFNEAMMGAVGVSREEAMQRMDGFCPEGR